jgi:hypothetical protein
MPKGYALFSKPLFVLEQRFKILLNQKGDGVTHYKVFPTAATHRLVAAVKIK